MLNLEEGTFSAFTEGLSVLGLSAATGSLLGWTGGQNISAGGEPPYSCVIDPFFGEETTPVAAGSEGKLFVLAWEFLAKSLYEKWEFINPEAGQGDPGVIEFGPKGSGCPKAAPGALVAEHAGNKPVGEEPVEMGESLRLSSYVNEADALKVEWDFGDGTSETVDYEDGSSETVSPDLHCPEKAPFTEYSNYKTRVRQCPSIDHAFARSGPLKVTEKVYTDNLATPNPLEQTVTVNVTAASGGPTAVLTGPLRVTLGQPATFDGKASSDRAGPNKITEYRWVFGDGQTTTTKEPTVAHTYASVGLYTVSLTVTDANGVTSAPATLPSPVAVEEASIATAAPIPPGSQSGASQSPPTPSGGGQSSGHPRSRPVPDVKLANASLAVGAEGKVGLVLSCPADERSCAGEIALRALVAGSARGSKKPKSAMTTLANGSFTLAGGRTKRFALRISASGRALIARLRKLKARLTIVAHDQAGVKHTTQVAVVLRPAPDKRRTR